MIIFLKSFVSIAEIFVPPNDFFLREPLSSKSLAMVERFSSEGLSKHLT